MRVEVSGVSFSYLSSVERKLALDGVSFTVQSGKVVAVLGASGSGKSTLLHVISGLFSPDAGLVRYNGQPRLGKKEQAWLRRRVGLALQRPEQQLFARTVLDDAMFAPLNHGCSRQVAREKALRALRLFGVRPEQVEGSPFALSGSERRKVALAGVMAAEPELLLLDEPTAGMHPGAAKEVLNAIHRYVRASEATCLIATHALEDVTHWADQVVLLANGSLIHMGVPEVLWQHPSLVSKAGIALPDIDQLAILLAEEHGVCLSAGPWDARGLARNILGYLIEDHEDEEG